MASVYDLAIVGAGLSTLSFLRAGGAQGRTLVVDYAEQPGGWLRFALPAEGLEGAWDLIASFQKGHIAGGQVPERDHAAYTDVENEPTRGEEPERDRPGQGRRGYIESDNVEMRLGNMAVGLLPGSGRDATQTLLVRSDAGTENIRARRVLIASGGLEVTREHDQIPGSRPVGVMTPLFVHQMLRQGYLPGTRTVVAGSARYAVATATRLAVAGAQVTLVPPVGTATPEVDVGVRVEEPAHIVEVVGFPRLERIRLQRGGQDIELPADMLVYARRMMANTLWLKGSGIELQPDGSIGVTARFETNLPGVFAMGTVVTPDLDHEASISMGRAAAIALEGSTA